MKKMFSIAAVALMLFACNNMSSPTQTVSTFIGAMKAKNYDLAVKCCTEKSGQTLRAIIGMVPEERLKETIGSDITLERDSIDPSGEKAWVFARTKDSEGREAQLSPFTLLKENGKWKMLIEKSK